MTTNDRDTFRTPLRDFPGYRLRAASQAAITELSQKLAELGLRLTEASILVAIQTNPKCRQSQIGRELHIASANLTPLLHQLEKRELIHREPLDGRTNALTLSEEGDRLATACLNAMQAHEERLTELIAPIDYNDFMKAMIRISNAFSD